LFSKRSAYALFALSKLSVIAVIGVLKIENAMEESKGRIIKANLS